MTGWCSGGLRQAAICQKKRHIHGNGHCICNFPSYADRKLLLSSNIFHLASASHEYNNFTFGNADWDANKTKESAVLVHTHTPLATHLCWQQATHHSLHPPLIATFLVPSFSRVNIIVLCAGILWNRTIFCSERMYIGLGPAVPHALALARAEFPHENITMFNIVFVDVQKH